MSLHYIHCIASECAGYVQAGLHLIVAGGLIYIRLWDSCVEARLLL